MDGVTILSTTEVAVEYTCNWWLAGLIFLVIVIVGGIIGFVTGNGDKAWNVVLGSLIGVAFGFVFWFLGALMTEAPVAYESQYKVTISDEVSMNEFMEKYEIVEQDGKIYTVRERD